MVLTYKVKHNLNLTTELVKAKQIAEFAISNRDKLSTKYISHFGLKSIIANQILRKYGRNHRAKNVKSVKLTVPSQGIRLEKQIIKVPSLRTDIPFNKKILKVRQIEFDETFAYISCEVSVKPTYEPKTHIGIDLNTTGHCAVVAVKETGKTYKLGKRAEHIHKKYKNIRKSLQKLGKYKMVKKIKNRESRIIKDLNHKISRKIVDIAVAEKGGVSLEKLQYIRKTTKSRKSFKYALNSWSFYQLQKFIEYKALLAGVPVSYIESAYTSKCCSRCGQIGTRNDKYFKCPCGHVDNADVNAAFNIALISPSICQFQAEKRSLEAEQSDTRQKATQRSYATLEPHWL